MGSYQNQPGSIDEDRAAIVMPRGHLSADAGDESNRTLNTSGQDAAELADAGHTKAIDDQAPNVNPMAGTQGPS